MRPASWSFREACQQPDRKGGRATENISIDEIAVVFYYCLNTGKEVIDNL